MPAALSYDPEDKDLRAEAEKELAARRAACALAWDYYEGRHKQQLKVRPGKPDDNVVINQWKQGKDREITFLFPKMPGFELDESSETDSPDEQWLRAAWDFNRVGQIYRQTASRDAAYRDNPLHHAKQSWLFKNQADFAELTTQTVTADNAAELYPQALRLMHYSPEARVVQRVIDSGKLLGHDAQAQALTERLDDVKQSQPNK